MRERHDAFDLERFILAQDKAYDQALAELRAGHKTSHWMWFIFPQIAGLGRTATSRHYAISGIDEATAYLNHPVLGPRLRACASALLSLEGRSARDVLGHPDDCKLKSSATLFALVAKTGSVFEQLLQQYFGGQQDALTLERLPQHGKRCQPDDGSTKQSVRAE